MEFLQIVVERFQIGVVGAEFIGVIELPAGKGGTFVYEIRLFAAERFFARVQIVLAGRNRFLRCGKFFLLLRKDSFFFRQAFVVFE